ncbi:MAG: hypothetical protein FJ100_14675 [Deltaproteobacteria bacterium]|nr:hypothetical protein [Deltaproteobacteria bacterium]
MKLRLALPRLDTLDELRGELLVLSCFADDRPLRGLTGLCDWRLNGHLSRLVLSEFVDAHWLEATLCPCGGRLPFDRILVVGLGRRNEFNAQRFEETCRFVFARVRGLRVEQFAMMLPGRIGVEVGLRQALVAWRRAVVETWQYQAHGPMSLTLLEPQDLHRELLEPLASLERELGDGAMPAAV